MSSYRPISILSTVSKVIERLVPVRLRPQLLASSFSRLQSAYWHSHVMNSVHAAAGNTRATILIGLDISALSTHQSRRSHQPPQESVRRRRRCFQLAALVPHRHEAVRESRPAFIGDQALHFWRASRVGVRSSALHNIRVASRRPHRDTSRRLISSFR